MTAPDGGSRRVPWPEAKAGRGLRTVRPPWEADAGPALAGLALAALLLVVGHLADWPSGARDLIGWLLEAGR